MRKIILKIAILLLLLISVVAKSSIVLPYIEDFDDKEIGSSFEDWSHPLGEILGPDSNPFGESIPFNENYLFLSGSQGQAASAIFSEINNNVKFNLNFCSLPNPNYDPLGAFRGGAGFLILADSDYSRDPRIGVEIHGEMWQNPDDLNVSFIAYYLDGSSKTSIPIGTIGHGEIYNLNITLNQNIVNVNIISSSTSITHEYILSQIFPADEVMIWEGSYPANEYGVGIDNIIVIPEPATIGLLALGTVLVRRRKQ